MEMLCYAMSLMEMLCYAMSLMKMLCYSMSLMDGNVDMSGLGVQNSEKNPRVRASTMSA